MVLSQTTQGALPLFSCYLGQITVEGVVFYKGFIFTKQIAFIEEKCTRFLHFSFELNPDQP